MDSETKVVYHGATVMDASQPHLPAYSQAPGPIMQAPGPMQGPGPMQSQPTAIIQSVPRVIVAQQFGPQSSTMVCPSCRAEIMTKTEMKPATKAHIFAAIFCFCGCWCLVCVPYCMNSCKDVQHYCANCNSYIGEYKSKF